MTVKQLKETLNGLEGLDDFEIVLQSSEIKEEGINLKWFDILSFHDVGYSDEIVLLGIKEQ